MFLTTDIFLSQSLKTDPDDWAEEGFRLLLQRHQWSLGLFVPSLLVSSFSSV